MDIDELLETIVENGGPFSEWVTVERNTFGGVDITNTRSGESYRVAVDDETVYLHVFKGGKARLLSGTLTFNGFFTAPVFVAAAMKDLL